MNDNEEKQMYTLKVNNKQLADFMKELRENPEIILTWSKERQKWYIRGFFDGKGSVYLNDYGLVILAIESHIPIKLDLISQILKEQYNIQSLVFHGEHQEILTEPSQLLIAGVWDIIEFNKQIGMENKQLKKKLRDALNKLLDEALMEEGKE